MQGNLLGIVYLQQSGAILLKGIVSYSVIIYKSGSASLNHFKEKSMIAHAHFIKIFDINHNY